MRIVFDGDRPLIVDGSDRLAEAVVRVADKARQAFGLVEGEEFAGRKIVVEVELDEHLRPVAGNVELFADLPAPN